jgi:hypothetical protein
MKWQRPLAALVAVCCISPATADELALQDEMRYLRERVQVLEDDKAERTALVVDDRFAFGGLVEVEALSSEPHDGGDSESDIVLTTVELWAEAKVNDWTTAQLVLLYEDDGATALDVDQGIITVGNVEASPFYLSVGQMYVPFGRFETTVVSDPLTLELGETRESALQVGFDNSGLYGSVYAFNGDVDDGGNAEAIEHYGANLGFRWETEASGLDVGASYIANLAETDGLQEQVPVVGDRVPGIGVHSVYTRGPWTVIGEYLGATKAFDELPFNGAGARPIAWNLAAGYVFELMGRDASVGIAHERTGEAFALGLPETRSLIALSVAVMDNAAVSIEYATAADYSTADGGSGESGNAVTLQLAAEF